jgi:bifunctional non-homologous end joining protein LigD
MKKVKLTHLDKLYWPDEKITKGDLVNYYQSVSSYILPYLKNRPLSLKRNPNGIKGPAFFHKDAGDLAPEWMKTADIKAESTNKMVHYLVCNELQSLLFIANLGCIEMNPWNSVVSSLDKPDYLVMDLDPSDKNSFDEVVDAANVIKAVLDKAGMEGFCKTSGSSGMHVYIPCKRKYEYSEVREFAKLIATLTHEQMPVNTTMERSLSKRKNNQIYIDYLQNSPGQTLASAYSVRPKPGATVSAPLKWKEVRHGLNISDFTIRNMMKRIERAGDLFKGVLGPGMNMKPALKKLGRPELAPAQ